MKTQSTKRVRVIIRPWTPRKMPYAVTRELISTFIQTHYPDFEAVVYAGWSRKLNINGSRKISFYVATGKTSSEARKRFKESNAYGKEIWEITDNGSSLRS